MGATDSTSFHRCLVCIALRGSCSLYHTGRSAILDDVARTETNKAKQNQTRRNKAKQSETKAKGGDVQCLMLTQHRESSSPVFQSRRKNIQCALSEYAITLLMLTRHPWISSPVLQPRMREIKRALSEYAIDTFLMPTRHL